MNTQHTSRTRLLLALAATLLPLALQAQAPAQEAPAQEGKKTVSVELPQWVKDIKFSGYAMLQYQAQDGEQRANTFNLRLLRLMLDGKTGDVAWRMQLQGSGSSAYLVDLYAEWQKYRALRLKAGQFKRAFTFENPENPINQGFYSYALAVNALVGYGDRTGEKSSGGRDIGIQLQGDLLENKAGRSLLHYQIGVYNGEGINTKDADNRKDIIGGLWVMPLEGLRIGAFGWTGSRAGVGEKNRYALSAEYKADDWTLRSEYIHSQGAAAPGKALGDKADGLYALAVAPLVRQKFYAKARYNLYRQDKTWSSSKTMYEVGFNYLFSKKLQINAEYARVNDRTLTATHHNYNFMDIQLDLRF